MNELMKAAGERDALSAFNLAHGTPRPPPSWAQEWLEGTRKSGTKQLTIPSMREKKAFEPLSMAALGLGAKAFLATAAGKALLGAGTGAGLHVGSNLLQKAITRFRPDLAQKQFASGLAHGMSGRKLHPVQQSAIRLVAGPEYLAQYDMGQAAAKQMVGLSPEKQQAYLRHAGTALKETKHISKAPIVDSIPGGIDSYQAKDHGFVHKHLLKTVPADAKTPTWQKAVVPVAAMGAAAMNPAAALHWGPQLAVNAIRDRVSKSSLGRKFMANELAQGARGKEISPLRKRMTDLFISPAANAPREIGLAAHKEYADIQGRANNWLADRGHGPAPFPEAKKIVDYAEGVAGRMGKKTPPSAPAAGPESGGNLGRALMLGGGLYALRNRLQDDQPTQ